MVQQRHITEGSAMLLEGSMFCSFCLIKEGTPVFDYSIALNNTTRNFFPGESPLILIGTPFILHMKTFGGEGNSPVLFLISIFVFVQAFLVN